MTDIPFVWEGQGDFHLALSHPIQSASISMLAGRPSVLCLWYADGSCLSITNQMYDLADRLEVGSLIFSDVHPTEPRDFEFEIGATPLSVKKLVLVEGNVRVESGVAIQLTSVRELVVLPGAFPYTLAVAGPWNVPNAFEPEYPMSRYRQDLIYGS